MCELMVLICDLPEFSVGVQNQNVNHIVATFDSKHNGNRFFFCLFQTLKHNEQRI